MKDMLNWPKELFARASALLRPRLERIKRDGPPLFRSGLERVKRDGPPLLRSGLERVKRVDLSLLRAGLERGKRDGLRVGVGLTLFYLLVILLLRGGDAWALVWEGKLNELGDFLAGVSTPLAFGWLVYGYFLQTRELGLQRQELEETRKTLGEQVELLKKRDEAEYKRSVPRLKLELAGPQSLPVFHNREFEWEMQNSGGPIKELTLSVEDNSNPQNRRVEATTEGEAHGNQVFKFRTAWPDLDAVDQYEARFTSARLDRFYQRWEIRRAEGSPPVKSEEITDGPTPVED